MDNSEQSVRIQTSFLNGIEKRFLIYLAGKQPRWMTSDILTIIGFIGAVVIAAGYMLSNLDINYIWLSSLGFVINWYGDSLDGTLARTRNQQRPVYGFYIDHTVDAINEFIMFAGAGLSAFIDIRIALLLLIVYLLLTLNVSVNAHLKGEFKLTYAKLGPTEFRIIAIILNTLLIYIGVLRNCMNYICLAILFILSTIYIVTIIKDSKYYAKKDPLPNHEDK
ncbi:MAG: CDP-alcohol phosphatidyltransferase family protein [Bacteroidales bacterium]|jgi:phosphatidylglycerophosphate synthase|nr:CDP-alcohol phosphatidyltransferase family protein [Bacteroidales bacterium]MCI1786208.1 CDP-alcohol phosphatidyltransferase family protein [Bacteroidales bacterium]